MSSDKNTNKLRFSVIDAVILIVILAVIASMVLRFTTDLRLFNYDTEKYVVTVKACGIRYTSIDMISSEDKVFLADGELLGILMHAPTVTPMLSYTLTSAGEMVAVYYPDNTLVDIILEIECDLINENGSAMTKNGVHIASGVVMDAHTPAVDLNFEIVNVEKTITE